jgi:hypothetical protein
MPTLVLALYAEGRTDERFLPILVQRVAEKVLSERGISSTDVVGPLVINHDIDRKFTDRKSRILEAARRAHGYHALLIHSDADHATDARAYEERINPGFESIGQSTDLVCRDLIPLMPVQMTEAWMLVDLEALCKVIGTKLGADELGVPKRPGDVESIPNPKQHLQKSIRVAIAGRPRRRRNLPIATLQEPLARQINLEKLYAVPSFYKFVMALTERLIALRMIK